MKYQVSERRTEWQNYRQDKNNICPTIFDLWGIINHRNFGKLYLSWQNVDKIWLTHADYIYNVLNKKQLLFKASCSIYSYTEIFFVKKMQPWLLVLLNVKVKVARGISIEVHFTGEKIHGMHRKDRFTGFRWRVGSWGTPGKIQNWSLLTNSRRRCMADIADKA